MTSRIVNLVPLRIVERGYDLKKTDFVLFDHCPIFPFIPQESDVHRALSSNLYAQLYIHIKRMQGAPSRNHMLMATRQLLARKVVVSSLRQLRMETSIRDPKQDQTNERRKLLIYLHVSDEIRKHVNF